MHAGRVSSLKRTNSLEQRTPRLHRGLTNGDLSREDEAISSPWYVNKWNERQSAFKSAQGISWFHMFAVIALLGVGLMVGSLFAGPTTGLLEIGVSAFLFSILCLIFVRCDTEEEGKLIRRQQGEAPLTSIVIETQVDEKGEGDAHLNEASDQIRALLIRSSPRKIPSPLRVFGYEMNFSPIQEMSEPSSCASSFITRNTSFPSRLATSNSAADSLSRVSSKVSCGGGMAVGGVGELSSPIKELEELELEDFDYDLPLQLNIDHNLYPGGENFKWIGPEETCQVPLLPPPPNQELDQSSPPTNLDLLSLSNLSLNSNSLADLSVITVIERKQDSSSNSEEALSNESPGTSSGSGDYWNQQ